MIKFCFSWKEAIWSLTRKKQGNEKEKLTESLHLTIKIARRSNYNIDLRKLHVNKITGRRNHKEAPNEKPIDSPQWFSIPSSILFSISLSKTRGILPFKIKIKLIEMFEPHKECQGWDPLNTQATIPLKFFVNLYIIMPMFRQSTNQNHYPVFGWWVTSLDCINSRSIQTLLRGENDLKQSDEFQAKGEPAISQMVLRIMKSGVLRNKSS